VRTVRSAKQD
jgi:hypothetical protein